MYKEISNEIPQLNFSQASYPFFETKATLQKSAKRFLITTFRIKCTPMRMQNKAERANEHTSKCRNPKV